MALRDQPYLPLYIQDIMTDEKLNECSASTHGIYIKGIMCLMHKSEEYGKILLKQKYKQTESMCLNFASQLVKHLPYSVTEIETAIDELIREKVCYFEDDYLCQKRMIKDNAISLARSEAGKKGGGNPSFVKTKVQTKLLTNPLTNSENENENENEYENENDIEVISKKKEVVKPELKYPKGWSGDFDLILERWIAYKKQQHKFTYKQIGLQGVVDLLWSMSGGVASVANEIVNFSSGNGYKGLIQPKNGKSTESDFERRNREREQELRSFVEG